METTKPIAAFISKVMTMADKGIRLWLDLNEIGDDELTQLLRFKDESGYFLFSREKVEAINIESGDDWLKEVKTEKPKTHSQRLRHAIYRKWQATQSANVIDAEKFYEGRMEKIIEKELDF